MRDGRWPGVLSDVAGYASESAVRLLMAAATGVLVARYLGPEGLGLLSYAGSVFALLTPMALLGMRQILVREFSTKEDWQTFLVSALAQQLVVALLTSLIGFAVIVVTRDFEHDATLIALALLPLPVFALGDTLRAYLEASGRVRWVVATGVTATIAVSLFKVFAILSGAPIWVFALAVTIEAALMMGGFLLALRGHRTAGNARKYFRPEVARNLLRESWPLLLGSLGVMLYMRADVFMLGLLANDQATGIYAAASRVSEVWYFLPLAVAAAVRPRLARLFANSEEVEYNVATQRFLSAALGAALAAVVVTLLIGNWLVVALYGPDFAAAGGVLRIHVLATPFVFLGIAASQWFIDRGMTRWVMTRSAIGAGTNVILNLILIPSYGASGAAVATLVSYALAAVLINAAPRTTRQLFWMQVRALILARR